MNFRSRVPPDNPSQRARAAAAPPIAPCSPFQPAFGVAVNQGEFAFGEGEEEVLGVGSGGFVFEEFDFDDAVGQGRFGEGVADNAYRGTVIDFPGVALSENTHIDVEGWVAVIFSGHIHGLRVEEIC